jgi:hypothetical protein
MSLFPDLVTPPASILAEAQGGISLPPNVTVTSVASVAAGVAAAAVPAGVVAPEIPAVMYALTFNWTIPYGASASTLAGLSAGPAAIVGVAATILASSIADLVQAKEFPGKLAAATQQAETYQSITQLMGSTAGQVGVATDLAGILAAGLPGGTTPASGT